MGYNVSCRKAGESSQPLGKSRGHNTPLDHTPCPGPFPAVSPSTGPRHCPHQASQLLLALAIPTPTSHNTTRSSSDHQAFGKSLYTLSSAVQALVYFTCSYLFVEGVDVGVHMPQHMDGQRSEDKQSSWFSLLLCGSWGSISGC